MSWLYGPLLPGAAQSQAAGGGDVSVTGATLTVTPTLTAGTATGTASVSGTTLSPTVTLIAGTVSAGAAVAGVTLSVSPTLTDGTATGTASVTGATLTPTITLIEGVASTPDVSVSGQTLTITPTLIAGSVSAAASVSGATLTVSPTLVEGAASGGAAVSGVTLTPTVTLTAGTATGTASVAGQTLSLAPTLIDGSPSGAASVTGATLAPTVALIDGTVSTAGSVAVSGETFNVVPLFAPGEVTVSAAPEPARGGGARARDFGERSSAKVRLDVSEAELREAYNAIHGITPKDAPKATRTALERVRRTVAPHAMASALAGPRATLPAPDGIDWNAVLADIAVQRALLDAYTLIMKDEEDAITALLLAA